MVKQFTNTVSELKMYLELLDKHMDNVMVYDYRVISITNLDTVNVTIQEYTPLGDIGSNYTLLLSINDGEFIVRNGFGLNCIDDYMSEMGIDNDDLMQIKKEYSEIISNYTS